MLCLLALLVSLAAPAHGEDLSSVTATVDSNQHVTISGRIDGGGGQTVNILVRDPNDELEYLNTCLSAAGGLFRVSYTLTNTAAGRYTVTVGVAGVANVAATSFLIGVNSLDASAALVDGLVRVTGAAGTGPGRLITVRITAPDGGDEYAGYAMSGAGGGFSLSYALANTQTGRYTVYVGAAGVDTPAVCYFLAGVRTEVKASIDKEKLVTVDGLTEVPDRPLSVQITDPVGKPEYLAGLFPRKDGTFALSYTMANETKGRYKVSVNAKGLDAPATAEFVYGSGLTNLTLSTGALSPAFTGDTTQYSAEVKYETGEVTVTPHAVDSLAVILVNGAAVKSGTASGAISLNEGDNAVQVQVTEADGSQRTYTVNVARAHKPLIPPPEPPPLSANANLSGLTVSAGALSPAFSSAGTSYTLAVGSGVSSLAVTPRVADGSAAVKVNTVAVASGNAATVALNLGTNTIHIAVTAENGATKTYTVTVTRQSVYTVTVGSLTGGTVTASPTTAAAGTTVNLTVTPNPGWQLKAGTLKYNDGTDHVIPGSSFTMPGKNVTVTAQFEQLYTVTVDGGITGGTIQVSPTTAAAGTTVNLTVTPDPGYGLVAGTLKYTDGTTEYEVWQWNAEGRCFIMLPADVTVTAQFAEIPFLADLEIKIGYDTYPAGGRQEYTLSLEKRGEWLEGQYTGMSYHAEFSRPDPVWHYAYPYVIVNAEPREGDSSVEIRYSFLQGEEVVLTSGVRHPITGISVTDPNPIYLYIEVTQGDHVHMYTVDFTYTH